MQAQWRLYNNNSHKFPYILEITQDKHELLKLLVQDKWPGQKGNIFCMRIKEGEPDTKGEEIERYDVKNYKYYGPRIYVTLDRATRKRCSFLIINKKYKRKEGSYEQIFWQTQEGITQRKPKVKLSSFKTKNVEQIIQDSSERYPWQFPVDTIKRKLPVGDYAIEDEFGYTAIVERKTLTNFLHEVSNLPKFHQQLHELEAYKHGALVVEASYSDLLKPDKIKPLTANFMAKAIAEIFVLHPKLQIVFLVNRKVAEAWTLKLFEAVSSNKERNIPTSVAESTIFYGDAHNQSSTDVIRQTIMREFPEKFKIKHIRNNFPEVTDKKIRKALEILKQENKISFAGGWWFKK